MNAFGNFGQAGREDGFVAVYISPGSTTFPPVPIELNSFFKKDEWDRRLNAISQLSRRYSKPLFERIWIFLGFIIMLATPIVVYRVLADKFLQTTNNFRLTDEEVHRLNELRLISFGIFVAVLFVIWAPFLLWKGIGNYRMRVLIKEWSKIDALAKNKGLYIPIWTVSLPSGYSNSTTVRVSIPPRSNPTVFHPEAYLPPYIAPPQYLPGYTGYNQAPVYGFADVKI